MPERLCADLWLRGFLLGFAIAAPVGPIGILCIRRTLAQGWLTGFVTGLGAATADAVYGSVAAFGLTAVTAILVDQQAWFRVIGGIFLCYLGARTLASRPAAAQSTELSERASLKGAYLSTFVLTLTNPLTILSFAAAFAALGMGNTGGSYACSALLVLGVFAGSALWWLILSSIASLIRGRIGARAMLWVNRVSGGIILAFGVAALLSLFA